MGANKTSAAIVRASKSAAGVEQIVTKFDSKSTLHKQSTAHTLRSFQGDENVMIKDLIKLQPFRTSSGRYHKSFTNLQSSILAGMDMENLFTWLDSHKKNIAMNEKKSQRTNIS